MLMNSHSVVELIASIERFNLAMDGPSGDRETEAACRMRDAALMLLREVAVDDGSTGEPIG
jgi:hypothetical protein